MLTRLRTRLEASNIIFVVVLLISSNAPKAPTERRTVVDVESVGVVYFISGYMFEDTEVGGLSGIAWDEKRDVYYALSDDSGRVNPARFYTVSIDLSDGSLDDGDVVFLDVTTLRDDDGQPFPRGSIDLEGIAVPRPDQLLIASEGDADTYPVVDPFVRLFNPQGDPERIYPIPAKFLPDGHEIYGVRENRAFESLTSTPDRRYLYTATEGALAQDGPMSGVGNGSLSRILMYRMLSGWHLAEYVYVTDPVPLPPDSQDSNATNGLVELAALDNSGTLLAMERTFSISTGSVIRIYEALTQDATDVSAIDDLYDESTGRPAAFVPVDKRLVADLNNLVILPDNVEGMTLGPVLPDGRQALILVSDNNFNFPFQVTQFIALALEIETVQ
jgi:hypothetical protein